MAVIDVANLNAVIMRSAGSDPGHLLYNAAGHALAADKPDAAAANPGDHYMLRPAPVIPVPVVAPPPPLSPTCNHDMTAAPPPLVGGLKVDFSVGNTTVFLPFKANIIASAVLEGAAGPGFFFTAELSGCSIFIDKHPGTGRVIVYHANGRNRCATAAQIQANWQVEWVPTPHTNYMDPLYALAHASYLASYPGLALQGTLTKAQYGNTIQQEITRKAGQGRNRPTMLWGTNVFGVRNGAVWSFYYQTFGGMEEYDRPFYSPRRWKETKQALGAGKSFTESIRTGKEVRSRGFGHGGAYNTQGLLVLDHQMFCQC